MIKAIEYPNKEFNNKQELFKSLKEDKENLVGLKKAKSVIKSSPVIGFDKSKAVSKMSMEDNNIYAVINTTNFMDSHNDVHLKGIWNKSVKEQKNNIYYITNHDFNIGSVIAYPKDVNAKVELMEWSELGFNLKGSTEALVYEVSKDKIIHKEALKIINDGVDIQHSVCMQYVKIELCVNDEGEDYKEEKLNYDKYISEVVNAEKAEDNGYFWAVIEAKIYREGSMVLNGSNEATPLLQKDNIEPLDSTLTIIEPTTVTQKNSLYSFN